MIAHKKHINNELGELICIDSVVVQSVGIEQLVATKRGQGDLTDMSQVHHPARGLLRQYRHRGVPVVLQTLPWTAAQLRAALNRGPHKSAHNHIDFLQADMANMVKAGQWVVLPINNTKHWAGMRISPIGVVPQWNQRPRPIVDYTFSGVNQDTVPIAALDAMQFG